MAATILGTVGNGIGIGSFAVQLHDSISKAIDFCNTFQDIPESIQHVGEGLRTLKTSYD
jgi:hypothetical protein